MAQPNAKKRRNPPVNKGINGVRHERGRPWELNFAPNPKTHDLMIRGIKEREHGFQTLRLGDVHVSRSPEDLEIGVELHECMN